MLICATTARSVGNWIDDPGDPEDFVRKYFCSPDPSMHMKTELLSPYKFPWYAKQYPFSRGENLTKEEAETLVLTDPLACLHWTENKKIASTYNKNEIPQWFNGKILTIVCDQDSHKWLMQRRKKLFYKFLENKVYLTRFLPEYIPNPNGHNLAKFNDTPQTVYKYNNEDDFVEWDYLRSGDKIIKNRYTNINLTDILKADLNQVLDTVNICLEDTVDIHWCKAALTAWRLHWTK